MQFKYNEEKVFSNCYLLSQPTFLEVQQVLRFSRQVPCILLESKRARGRGVLNDDDDERARGRNVSQNALPDPNTSLSFMRTTPHQSPNVMRIRQIRTDRYG
jgi:hypothetical protein